MGSGMVRPPCAALDRFQQEDIGASLTECHEGTDRRQKVVNTPCPGQYGFATIERLGEILPRRKPLDHRLAFGSVTPST